MYNRKKGNIPHSNLRDRLEEYALLKEKTRWQGSDSAQEKSKKTLYDFFPLSILKDMHSLLLLKVTIIFLLILIFFSLSLLRLPFTGFILDKVQYVTTWDMDFVGIGEQALPAVAGLWEGDFEENLESVILAPNGQVIDEGEENEETDGSLFVPPLEGELKRSFGQSVDPLTQKEDMCYGIVVAVPVEDYVNAAANGVVKEIGEHSYYGLYLILEHEEGVQSFYGYLEEVLVENGGEVEQGEKIAMVDIKEKVGSALLYFELRERGSPVDPLPLLEGGR